MEGDGEKRDVRRPMNAFLIFCKRHRSMVREKNPDLDNRSVTRILGDLWANLKEEEKCVYTDLAKQYKDAFMKANPDYKWHNPDKAPPSQKQVPPKPTNMKVLRTEIDLLPEGSIMPGKLADPSNMGGLSLLLMAGQHNVGTRQPDNQSKQPESRDPAGGTNLPDSIATEDREPVSDAKITTNQKAVEEAINRRLCESAIKYNERHSAPEQKEVQPKEQPVTNNMLSFGQSPSAFETDRMTQIKNFQNLLTVEQKPPLIGIDRPASHDTENPVKFAVGKLIIDGEGSQNPNSKTSKNTSLLELAEMCSNALGHKQSPSQPIYSFQSQVVKNGETVTAEAQKTRAPVYKGMLAEALLDTCNKGNYPSLIKRDIQDIKSNTENSASDSIAEQGTLKVKNSSDGEVIISNSTTTKDEKNDTVLKTSVSEKSEISRILVADVKQEDKTEEEESAMVTCGKKVVNHIIDKLYFSDLATAARRVSWDKQEKFESKSELGKGQGQGQANTVTFKSPADLGRTDSTETTRKNSVSERKRSDSESSNSDKGNVDRGNIANSNSNNFDEHDGSKGQGQTKTVSAPNKYVSKSLKDKILSRVMKEQSEMLENKEVKKEDQDDKNKKKEDSVSPDSKTESPDTKTETVQSASEPQVTNRKRTISQNSNSGMEDVEGDERDDFHPVRKSKRRNRGQRYQELINEGIIQPSKERMAAIMHDSKNESGEVEDFQSIDSHILPETAIRRIRKRTISESDKGRVMSPEEAKRYKTGDFDLEAHIATLPACCIENLGRKRGFARQRHFSETCPNRKQEDSEEPASDIVIDMEKTVSLPPHIKIPSPEKTQEPVTGSRKRKARKHSITHLLPAPAPPTLSNIKKDSFSTKSSQSYDQVKNCQQNPSASEEPPGKQTVSVDSLQPKCSECAKTENKSNVSFSFTVCRKDEEYGSFKTELPSEDSGMKSYAKEETGLQNDISFTHNSGSTGENCDRNLVSVENATKASGVSQVIPQFCFPIARESKTVTTSASSFDGFMPQEYSNSRGSNDACKDEMFKLPSDTEDSTSKSLDNADQCKNENQSVLHSNDSERKKTETEDQSGVMKACDLLQEGGILYSDDLVLEEKAAKRSETSEHLTSVSENSRGRVIGKNTVEPFSDKKETYLQNKENVIHTEGLKIGRAHV